MISKKSAVYISHRLSSTRFCDNVAMFRDGEMIEYGTHDALLKAGGAYAGMFEIQAQYYKGFFFCGIFNVLISAVQPFVPIMMMPLILDELLGERNTQRLILYVAVIAVGGTALSLAASVAGIILENTMKKWKISSQKQSARA